MYSIWEVSEINQIGEICLNALVADLDLGEFVDLVLRTLERRVWVQEWLSLGSRMTTALNREQKNFDLGLQRGEEKLNSNLPTVCEDFIWTVREK